MINLHCTYSVKYFEAKVLKILSSIYNYEENEV